MTLSVAAEAMERAPFAPPRWLRSPHLQTIAGSISSRMATPSCHLLVESERGTRILCHLDEPRDAKATLVIVHGMGGSSDSSLARDLARAALRENLAPARMNMRNCGGTEHLTPTLYHGNLPQDLDALVRALAARTPSRPIVVAGYSVGGNLVLNTLAFWGASPPPSVLAAISICPTIDVDLCVTRLDAPVNLFYRRYFLRLMQRFYREKSRLDGARFPPRLVDRARTMREYDRLATGPDAGFDDVARLYRWVSSATRLAAIASPALVIQALDDPIVAMSAATRAAVIAHPHLTLVETALGGHCGFVERPSARHPDGRWIADHVARLARGLT